MKKVVQDLTSGGLLGVWGKWMKHAKYIYNIQDFNPEQVLAVGYTKSKFITDAMMWFDKFSCKRSDLVITVGRDLVETVENRFKGTACVCFFFTLFAPECIYVLGGSEYKEAVWVVPPVCMSVYFIMLYSLVSTVTFYYEKTKSIMVSSCIIAIFNIILNSIFIKRFGMAAAGYTTLVCYVLYAIDAHAGEKVLTHIDAVPDDFLFVEKDGKEEIRLIDWEYAGMQDPHVDVAMFCIYSLYNKRQVDRLIAAYFTEGCSDETRIKIYCYIAACGFLWSNWCEYKRNLGVEFGEYSLRQYRYAKDYYRIVQEELKKQGEEK